MSNPATVVSWAKGIAARRAPGRRVSLALLYGIPLLNILALAALGAAVCTRATTVPAMRLELPAAEFRDGAATPLFAALTSAPGNESSLVFFDSIRYRLGDPVEDAALAKAIAAAIAESGHDDVTLYADGSAQHCMTMRFAEIARRAGASAVNLAIREDPAK
ncbi:MAG: hypothetical protein IKH04_13325 [Kiritimatiellae bacterium]|nr:hypothetical protein [Kiritimatiellia bacterium]